MLELRKSGAKIILLIALLFFTSVFLYTRESAPSIGSRGRGNSLESWNSPSRSKLPIPGTTTEQEQEFPAKEEEEEEEDPSLLRDRDIVHTIKTSHDFHHARGDALLLTWLAPPVTSHSWWVTDGVDDVGMRARTGNHVITTTCLGSHEREGLNCKMQAELDAYLQHPGKWWCHWDDDMYVNVDRLRELLEKYDWQEEFYVGRASIDYPLQFEYKGEQAPAWFAHGGCGFCLSDPLARRINPLAREDGGLVGLGKMFLANDDCVIGFVATYLAGVELTQSDKFNSHYHKKELESLRGAEQLRDQISLSYSDKDDAFLNMTGVPAFPRLLDPTRFYSLHCLVRPSTAYCGALKEQMSTDNP